MTVGRASGRKISPTATLLLLLQVFLSAAVPLAHAGEREGAPGAIEAHHDASCVVIHDALRCALCQYTASLSTPPPVPRVGQRASAAARPALLARATELAGPSYIPSQSRAPPLFLS